MDSCIFQYVIDTKYDKKVIKYNMSDGYTYSAILDENGLPTFYKRSKTK